jgi:hypothetical protein
MFKASMVEGTLMIHDPKFKSWEELEVKDPGDADARPGAR